ncbi:MAG: EI24 domain-containing protein [Polyangiaceae bacterium]
MNGSNLPVATGPRALAGGDAPGFGAGVGALFSGLGFMVATPSAWPLALVPAVFFLAITVAVGVAGFELLPGWITPMLGPWATKAHGALAIVVKVLVAIVSVLVGTVLGFAFAQPLSGPALEKLVRKVEAEEKAPAWPETTILADIWRSLEGLLLTTALTVPILAFLFMIELVFPPAAIVTMPLKVVVTALMLAWDLCDYPLSIRGMPIRARIAFLRRHLSAVMGFGLGLALLTLIPCAILLVLPIGAAGATKLVVQIERWEASGRGGA